MPAQVAEGQRVLDGRRGSPPGRHLGGTKIHVTNNVGNHGAQDVAGDLMLARFQTVANANKDKVENIRSAKRTDPGT